MRCLLDKVTARHIMEGMLAVVEERIVTSAEFSALDLYQRAPHQDTQLFILPHTETLLRRLEHLPRYNVLIRRFLAATTVARPTRYFKRWARRLREYGFTKEDADILALATFGTTPAISALGMHVVATFDQPMMNQWEAQQAAISRRLGYMQRNLPAPYRHALLPQVQRPEDILGS